MQRLSRRVSSCPSFLPSPSSAPSSSSSSRNTLAVLTMNYSSLTTKSPSSPSSSSSSCNSNNNNSGISSNNNSINGGVTIRNIGTSSNVITSASLQNSSVAVPTQSTLSSSSASSSTSSASTSSSSTTITNSSGSMREEYGSMDSSGETFTSDNFILESGVILPKVEVRYSTFGKLNETKDNVIIVCHALTGNSRLDQWWGSMLGPGLLFDTDKYLIVCANVLGSCYGSSGPMTINPSSLSGEIYGIEFPDVTIRDTVNAHMKMVKDGIGAASIMCVVGGSMGGMQALEWTLLGGSFVKSAVIIGCGAAHTAWQIAISETQRQAIYADPKWREGKVDLSDPPNSGLSVARQIAMISYRTPRAYEAKFGRSTCETTGKFQARKYLEYQGGKFLDRFDAISYVKITEQMDTHDVGRNRGGVEKALNSIKSKVLIMGIDSDLLYPIYEQEEMAKKIPNCQYNIITSVEGHDGFLLEQTQVSDIVSHFLNDK